VFRSFDLKSSILHRLDRTLSASPPELHALQHARGMLKLGIPDIVLVMAEVRDGRLARGMLITRGRRGIGNDQVNGGAG
jgi:hypothetical protein